MRFFGFHWASTRPPDFVPEMVAMARESLGLPVLAEDRHWALLGRRQDLVQSASAGAAAIIGDLFTRAHPPRRIETAAFPVEAEALAAGYWGRYVAFARIGEADLEVFRDPSGGLPCFHARRHGVDLIFDTPEGPGRLGWLSGEIDWDFLAGHVAFGGLRGSRTGLVGVSEVLPGQVLRLGRDRQTVRMAWGPGRFCAVKAQITDRNEAVERLRQAVEGSIQALAATQGKIVLELSGGLDSSIVAMALRGREGTYAVNCATEGGEGDERVYAREVAQAAGLPLAEHPLRAGQIDFQAEPAPWLARPGRSTVLQTVDAVFAAAGRANGASAFFNGTGGDGVFCYTQSAGPAVDRLLAQGVGSGLVETLGDVATLTGANLWTVASRALRILRRRGAAPASGGDLAHLTAAHRALAAEPHPWLADEASLLPARRRHLRNIVAVQGHIDGFDRNRIAPVIAPHAAQPVIEMVLRIPTWMWIEGGRDRALARAAFADLLPPRVLHRRSKGRINHFIVEAYEGGRRSIGELLVGGLLDQNGVLDPAAVRRTLDRSVGYNDEAFLHVIRLVDAELWARAWQGRSEALEPQP